ncbi:DUF1501 domain-containing protein [Sandaracinus amylolyticus]|uniref:Tat (Twin-arginine translocation) pathway signal sequence domain protein n=1 Tax=Sandaracinus amylolyticus TaxID=927083 RepID=A0A0F6SHT1_9BACT|nr:DUF1501 domain-containing protein [Sandaracinus amylolyticus]AKF10984.1 Tat (Twin-arginine translocation) pathway signal sequence domain protein [Sandaracinus amylolyticus]
MHLGRRHLLRGAIGMGAVATFGAALGPIGRLVAQPRPLGRRLVACYFEGGWDVLLGPDARDPARTYPGIQLGTDLLDAEMREPVEVNLGGARVLWGAPMAPMRAHADVTTVFRGINMNTVAHPTGRAYVNTFMSPAGSAPRGSSLGTVFATGGELGPEGPILPFVSVGLPAFNHRYAQEANALQLDRPREVMPMLSGPARRMPTAIEALLAAAREDSRACIGAAYEGRDPAEEQRLSIARMERLESEGLASRFDFAGDSAEMQQVRTRYGFAANATDGAGLQAAVAAQLVKTGLSRSVMVRLSRGHDTHNANWATDQPTRLSEGFTAMSALIEDLRQDDPDLARTTVIAFSEFSRTPRLNGTRGRDHWFAASMVVCGGLRPGVFGATNPDDLGLIRVDPERGTQADDGMQLMPEHVAATIVAAAGLDATDYRVDPITSLFPAA